MHAQATPKLPPIPALLAALPARLSGIVRYWAVHTPTAVALREGGRHWCYGELDAAVDSARDWLAELQVRPGDRLMVVGENCLAQVALIFAAAAAGIWMVNLNARLSAREIDLIQQHCGARRVLYLSAISPEARAHALRAGAVPHTQTLLGELMVGALQADGAAQAPAASDEDQVAALIYTTGTTGTPKGVMLSHRNLLFIAAVSSGLRALSQTDRVYGVLPISHVYGLASVMLGTLYAGACLQLVPRYTPQALWHALQHDGITVLQGVPAMYARLLELLANQDNGAGLGVARPRFIYAGGSPLDPTLKQQVEQVFGQPLHNGYGMTESAPTISQTRLDALRSDTSVGHLIPGLEMRLVERDGQAVAAGATGELWVRGPNVMQGYYADPELTARTLLPGGWLKTGDLAYQAGDGALFIVGRTKELIIHSGFNVYPVEVEAALNSHPAVLQSAVVGRQVAGGNEEVVAFVELDRGQDVAAAELHAYLAGLLSPYKCPTEIVIVPLLPAAATGKILKGQLKLKAQQDYDALQATLLGR